MLDCLRTLEEKAAAETKELRLISAELCQRLDAQEEEGEKLVATVDDMRRGIGLDFETLIQTLAFKKIQLHLLHSGLE